MISASLAARNSLAATLVAVLAACGADSRSSAGETWRTDASGDTTPVLAIPDESLNGDVNFDLAIGATRLRDGTIVVGDQYGARVVFFGPDGRKSRVAGGEGEGPGEYRSVDWVGQCEADRIYVWDQSRNLMAVLDSHGRFLRSFHPPTPHGLPPLSVRCARSGAMAFMAFPEHGSLPKPDGTTEHLRSDFFLTDLRGNVAHVVGDMLSVEPRPAGRTTVFALSDQFAFVGTGVAPAIDVYGLDGVFRYQVELDGIRPRSPTPAHYRRAVEAMVSSSHDRKYRNQWRQRLLQFPMPDVLPPYHALFTDQAGDVWVQTSFPGDSTIELRALTPDGVEWARVSLPGDIDIWEVGDGYVLGARQDLDTGRQTVLVLRLEVTKPGSEGGVSS